MISKCLQVKSEVVGSKHGREAIHGGNEESANWRIERKLLEDLEQLQAFISIWNLRT
jgi:hypothetical protein